MFYFDPQMFQHIHSSSGDSLNYNTKRVSRWTVEIVAHTADGTYAWREYLWNVRELSTNQIKVLNGATVD